MKSNGKIIKRAASSAENGSVLIIVLWVALGLVSIALYFANSMSFEMRASDNAVASIEAQQAIDGAARYINYLLANRGNPGLVPDVQNYLGFPKGISGEELLTRGRLQAKQYGVDFLLDEMKRGVL